VKHSANNKLTLLFDGFIKQKNFSIKGVSFELLLYFAEQVSDSIYIITSKSVVEDACVTNQDDLGERFFSFLQPNPSNVGGFINFFDEATSISIQAATNTRFNKGVYFIDEKIYKKPIVPTKKKPGFEINKTTGYNKLIEQLDLLGYIQSNDILSSGFFVVRGGAIDIFPYNKSSIVRVSFLDDVASIYKVNKNTNQIKVSLNSFVLMPKALKQKESLEALIKKDRVVYYQPNIQLLYFNKENNIKELIYQAVDYQLFIKDFKSSPRVVFEKNIEVGFKAQGCLCVPSWFLGGDQKNLQSKEAFVNLSSLVYKGIYIHDDFGFCQYLGLENFKKQERVCLKFADGVVRLDVCFLSKLSFCSSDNTGAVLSYLNRPGKWKLKKERAFVEAQQFVSELINSYSKRDGINIKKYDTSSSFIDDFVKAFKYNDTKDQKSCWEDLLNDFASSSPVNRLICGDVGFGKTELAIRAAAVAVYNKDSVIVLAPTTLLANQLYHCFSSRLTDFGVSVGLLSRFSKTPSKTIKSFLASKTDVLVGTSSVLFKSELLRFCGLFIVDEEHRFGVKDKELVFKINPKVNFISMSATPLPRTLELSLKNVRNLSTIQTPPISRKPIISSVCFYNINLIINIIIKEISRGGQVYIVDNSVDNLKSLYLKLTKRLSGISVDLIFGTMSSPSLLNKMDLFVKGKTKVLLTTTIIESGIDISLTNTIIINNAHLFGLSQLYQLRGRVGRSSYQAFAWFLIPKKELSLSGTKRLNAIVKYSSLGSGYNISLEDLEIRGSGSLFGYKQSGVGGVGFEYYSKLLSLAINKEGTSPHKDCQIDLNNKQISSSFIHSPDARAFYYKLIFSTVSEKDVDLIKKEILNLYGFCPPDVDRLLLCQKLSFLAKKKHIKSIIKKGDVCVVSFYKDLLPNNLSGLIKYIDSFLTQKKLKYKFVNSYRGLIFQYQNSSENDYILMESFINNLSFIQ